MALLVGIACGVVAALPYVLCRSRGVSVAIVAVLVSFLLFHAGIVVLYVAFRTDLVPAAVLATCTFLAMVALSVRR